MHNLTSRYQFNTEFGTWQLPNSEPFNYSDGDEIENNLHASLESIQDKSLFSSELDALQKDWPTTYHLSLKRANLLRPLEKSLIANARVLELGCGCGAITRYLGECAREVYAVEGSARRGGIAALRCTGLDNVNIIIDRIQDLPETLGKFDVVTLIGVLEYARIYGGGKGAELALLRKARNFLKPDGALILALENKLGLKYLAGIPEDHLGISWASITNAYKEDGVITFSRKELIHLLESAGFCELEQFIPVPDYKLPISIITQEGIKNTSNTFDLGALLAQSRAYEEPPIFNLQEGWRSVVRAGLLPDLADSLCFIARMQSSQQATEPGMLVQHFGSTPASQKKFAKSVIIRNTASGITVTRKPLFPQSRTTNEKYTQILVNEPYFAGTYLIDAIRQCVIRPGWTSAEFAETFRPMFQLLEKHQLPNGMLPGDFIDMAPFNLVKDSQNTWQYFDREWKKDSPLPISTVLVRCLVHTFFRLGIVSRPADGIDIRYGALIKYILNHFNIHLSDEEIKNAWEGNDSLEKFLLGKVYPWENLQYIPLTLSAGNVKNIFHLNERNHQMASEINRLSHEILLIQNSLSWKITSPLRKIKKHIQTLFK